MTYTEELSNLQQSITGITTKLDTLITTINNNHVHDEEARERKKAEEKQLREEDRADRKADLSEHATELSTTLATEITIALTATLGTTLREVFREYLPHTNNRHGAAPPPPPPLFPTFNGDDPDSWIFSADQYFSLHVVADNLKLAIASAHLKDARMEISTIKQTGTVREHIPKFERLLNFVTDLPEDHLINCFIHSLKPEIGPMVKLLEPQTLTAAFTKAINQEDALLANNSKPNPYRPTPLRNQSPATYAIPLRKPNLPAGAKRLTWEEQKEKREKGECFNCDKLFTLGHLCLKPQLLLLEGSPDADANQQDTEIVKEPATEFEETPTLSFHSLMGSPYPRTMRISGFTKDAALRVTIGDGGHLSTQGFCPNIPLKFQNYEFNADFHLLPISGCDDVLGIQWLRTLGVISWDFTALTMQFHINGSDITLVGNDSSTVMMLYSSSMQRLLNREHYGILFQLSTLKDSSSPTVSVLEPEIQQLISTYSDIFETLVSLPPSRQHEHHIPLLLDYSPVNVRPYRYPHFQKNEIEKESSSPFSSPILMVRKKDGTWRMCVDYRALNKITIKDRFPIHMVGELMDELHGACVFTKLDLRSGYYQIRLFGPDIHKTSFRTHDGHYEFLVMPIGLSNAPATFQSLMNHIFKPYLSRFVLVFFDDILIFIKTIYEHVEHLQAVIEILRSHKLFVKETKCNFAQPSVGYLGHVISSEGVSVQDYKIKSILSWRIPSLIKELQAFLGLVGYYRKFVKKFDIISHPLTQLLKKDDFIWTDAATSSFKQLQHALTTTPVLICQISAKNFI
ncbi:uncharacterized protein LOC113353408 [Papaver somniferum]|uniref:uncharacterized protein LOC113353408 n=1 Tax=Papaver somniferum TaxID=3469 RepID=UPI000E6FE86E|nr:uncharacterized protein LOC113353408 [Papaver somniferum]